MRNPFARRKVREEATGEKPATLRSAYSVEVASATKAASEPTSLRSTSRLVVGLGNPGGEYLATRHNVGFEVVELLAARAGVDLRRWGRRQAPALRAEARIAGARVILIQPHAFMNVSGRTVRAAVDYFKTPLSRLLVICDDVHLPVGKSRLRRAGGPGGHNGLVSIIEALGSKEFPRLRVGVGEPSPYMDQVTYVLSRFAREEREEVAAAIARAADAVEAWVGAGIEEAMNRFN